ncbi:hypothetical protein FB192DRAFT_1261054, partial [Mucor lusitanicus]
SAHPQAADLNTLGITSSYVQCPYCLRFVYTTRSVSTGKLYLFIGTCGTILMMLRPGVLGALIIGFNVWFMANTLHRCPECSAKIATFKPLTRNTEIHS